MLLSRLLSYQQKYSKAKQIKTILISLIIQVTILLPCPKLQYIMSLLQETQIQTSVFICSFECFIRQANIAMKFPCSYFVEWRTVNSKISVKTQRHKPNKDTVNFEEKIILSVQMLYDHNNQYFLNRDTIVELFLISRSRPDQHKLVGRVNIDVGKVINVGMYEAPTEFKLNFCSIEGTIIMQFKASDQKITNLTINDLDKSSFIDFMSQKALRNQSMIHTKQSQNHQAKSIQKQNRSQIRAASPSSPKSAIKESLFIKANLPKIQPVKRESYYHEQEENKQSKISSKANDESQAKSKIVPRTNILARLKTQENQRQPSNKVQIRQNSFIQQNRQNENIYLKVSEKMAEHANKSSAVSPNSQNMALVNNNLQGRTIKDEIIRFKNAVAFQQKNEDKSSQQFMLIFNQNIELHRSLEERQTTALELQSKLKGEKTKYQNSLEEITRKNAIIEQFDKEITTKEQMILKLQTELNRSKAILSQNQIVKKRISTQQKMNQDLKEQLNQYQSRQAGYLSKIRNYQHQIKSLQKDHEECLKKINQNIKLESQTKKKIEELQIQNNQLISNLQEAHRQIFSLKNNQTTIHLQQELQNIKVSREKARMGCQKAEKQVSQIQIKYFQLQTLYDQLQASYKLLIEKGHNNVENQQNSSVVQEIVVESMPHIKHQQAFQGKNGQSLSKQNEYLSRQVQFLKANCQIIERQNSSLKNEKQSLKQQITSYQLKLSTFEQMSNQLNEAKLLNNDLSQYIQSLKAQIGQVNQQWQNQAEKDHQQIKELRIENQQLREQAKAIQPQIQFYEQELTSLKNEIIKIKQNRQVKPVNNLEQRCWEYKQMIDRLNTNLQQQINQNNQLSQAIVRYMQKQAKMKETLAVLQNQSKQIFSLVQQKEQNEQTYQKAIDDLQSEIIHLKQQQQSLQLKQTNKQELQQKMESRANQSHNDQLLKLQEKLLEQNNQLVLTSNTLKEENAKLNEELMLTCIENNQAKTKIEGANVQLKDRITQLQAESKKQEEVYLNKIKESQRAIKNKEIEVQIWKSRNSDKEKELKNYQTQLNQLRGNLEQIQEDKFNIQSLNHQKDIQIIDLTQQINALILINSSQTKQQSNPHLNLISELKDKLISKTWSSDWDSLLQSVLDKSVIGQQTSRLLNLEQKSRLLSKQLQKMKASLLKSEWRNQQQKVSTMGLFKKCEIIVCELISCAQSLNQNQSSFL